MIACFFLLKALLPAILPGSQSPPFSTPHFKSWTPKYCTNTFVDCSELVLMSLNQEVRSKEALAVESQLEYDRRVFFVSSSQKALMNFQTWKVFEMVVQTFVKFRIFANFLKLPDFKGIFSSSKTKRFSLVCFLQCLLSISAITIGVGTRLIIALLTVPRWKLSISVTCLWQFWHWENCSFTPTARPQQIMKAFKDKPIIQQINHQTLSYHKTKKYIIHK